MDDVDSLLQELGDLPGSQRKPVSAPPPQLSKHNQMPSKVTTCAPATVPSTAPTHIIRQSASTAGKTTTTGNRSSLDELMNELDIDSTSSTVGRPSAKSRNGSTSSLLDTTSSSSAPPSSRTKCVGLYIGGTSIGRGRNGQAIGSVMCCDNLRCTKCDFKASSFNNKAWAADVDYLFFRNNFPTESKLAAKLLSSKGAVAYCCQCSWVTAMQEQKIDYGGELRWVCGGH